MANGQNLTYYLLSNLQRVSASIQACSQACRWAVLIAHADVAAPSSPEDPIPDISQDAVVAPIGDPGGIVMERSISVRW